MAANIEIQGVGHWFRRSGKPVLAGIDAHISRGETIALVGRSGCGKSTLLHILAGLVQPAAGSVRIDGVPVFEPSPKWNLMFRQPSLYPWMSVAANAGLGLTFAGRPKHEIAGIVDDVLELVGLADYAGADVQTLSGGQQQRVALARSLATQPDVLLLDEPFSALDAFTRAALQDELVDIVKRLGLTVVLVTHDIDEAALMADRVFVMNGEPGRIAAEVPIGVPRPRERATHSFLAAKALIMSRFETTLCRKAA